jgi:hypothetical protein
MNSEAFRLRAQVFYAVTGMRVRCVNAKGTVLAVLPKPKAPPKPRTPKGAK